MADADKNILITPSVSQTGEPTIRFTGKNNINVTLRVLDDSTLSFEGTSGQLFSITDALTGTIFSVNDISGIPSLEILDNGTVRIAETTGNVGIGTTTPTTKLDVVGTITATAFSGPLTGNASTATSAATLTTARNINGVSFNGSANITIPRVSRVDNRTAAPSSFTANYASPLFTSWNNNSGGPYADAIVFRTYGDASGGNDNMLALRKDALGLRLWQQAYGSATAFATFKDVAWTDGTNATGTWAISTTGTAATVTGAAQTAITSVGTLGSLTVSGTATASTTITNELRTSSGQQLIINAGESSSYATGQTGEWLYVNAESGLQVNSSPDNWVSGWAGRKTATICAADGTSSFPGTITAPTFSGSGASLTSLPAGQLTGTVASARLSGAYTGITGVGTLTTLLVGQVCSTATVAGANDTGSFSVRGNATYPAVMSFHRVGTYAVNFGLSTANKMELGGWSASTIKFTWDMATGNYNAVGTITAPTFVGALTGNVTGNASTATNLSTNRTNWSTNGTISATVGQLAWKNYGNSHTIFDASQSTSPNGGAVNNTNAQIAWSSTYPTLMGWNGANTYGVRVDSARTSDNTTGNAATATSATTATNVSGGTVSGVSLVSVTRNQSSSQHGQQGVQVLSSGEVAGLSFWLTSHAQAPTLRAYYLHGESIDCGSNPGTGYAPFGASAFVTRCSAQWKDDIREKNGSEILNDTLAVLSIPVVKFNDKYGESIQDGDAVVPIETSSLSDEQKQNHLQSNHIDREGFIAETVAELFPKASMFDINGNASGTDMGVITAQLLDAVKLLVLQGEEFSRRLSLLEGS